MSKIREFVMNEPLFNSHEHQSEWGFDWKNMDYGAFWGYLPADVVSSKLPYEKNKKATGDYKTHLEVWDRIFTTGYGQAISLGIKHLFDIDFSPETANEVSERIAAFVANREDKDIHEELFKTQAGCKWVLADIGAEPMTTLSSLTSDKVPDFIRFTMRVGKREMLVLKSNDKIKEVEKWANKSLNTLEQLESALEEHFQKAMKTGKIACFKTAIAYVRDLDFKQVSIEKASAIYDKIRLGKSVDNYRPLHDYLLHMQLKWADAHQIPVQIHTGYLAGNNQDIRQGDPSKLIPLFIQYPNVRFYLFHAGWPFSEIMGAIAKQYPNVCLDMCWAWAMAPQQMERTLDEWLSAVPNNKIIGFGGDTWSPFATVGYAKQARIGIANCLNRKIQRGEYSQATAEMIAKKIMWENGLEMFPSFK